MRYEGPEYEPVTYCIGGCGTDVSYDGVFTPGGDGPYCDECFSEEMFYEHYGDDDELDEYLYED